MAEKRAVSKTTQVAMEAFVPWVYEQLNDLVWIPSPLDLVVKARLEEILVIAKVALQNVDDKSRKEGEVWEWLDKVKDISYETVDVFKERPSKSRSKQSNRPNNKVSSYAQVFFSKFWFRRGHETASRLKNIISKLEFLHKKAASSGYVRHSYEAEESESLDIDISTCCRTKDKECVEEQLLSGTLEGTDVKVVSIVGRGGMGKTTLAKCVYRYSDEVEKHFELRVWVSVSNCFDEERMARDMLLCIVKNKLKKKESNCLDEKRIVRGIYANIVEYKSTRKEGILLREVKKKEAESSFVEERRILVGIEEGWGREVFELVEECFSGKVFLCVFDDVWTECDSSRLRWMKFASLIKNGAPGSRILVTTRSEIVAQVVGSEPHWTHNLEPLSNKEWWELWRYNMKLNESNPISDKMFNIGFKIKEKCGGLPLFGAALGEILMLADNSDVGWEGELNNWSGIGDKMWEMKGDQRAEIMEDAARKIFRHFYSTYPKLSPTLKLCILFCADFEKSRPIVVDQLIKMWMAQGYLGYSYNVTDDANTLKGLEHFHELASLGFFHKLQKGSMHKNKITSCDLDDTFHDFIRYKARHDLAALDQDKYISVRERHFHVTSYSQVPHNFSGSRWKGIRSLVLSSLHLGQVPGGIESLSRLQYLDLSNNTFQELPEALCELQSLHFLDVHDCYLLVSLPHNIKKLKQLKHLRVADTTDELHNRLPPGFEELTSLLSLDVFRVGGTYKDTIQKLKEFADIVDICITVHGEVNLSDADFGGKRHLTNLELCFQGEGMDQENAIKSIKDLKPPLFLQMLKFDNYPLRELPSWILDHSLIKHLTRLTLKSAPNLTLFPALWKLLTLEFLWLSDFPNLKHIGREFLGLPPHTLQLPGEMQDFKASINYIEDNARDILVQGLPKQIVFSSLKTLRIDVMKNLQVWEDISEDEKMADDITVLPSLEELIIDECPKLLKLPRRILGVGDTPWFNITESAVLPEEKDHCMELKALLEAYSHKYSRDHLEVAIPGGLLGKREADKERVQMVSSGLITTLGRTVEQPDTRAEDLVKFIIMKQHYTSCHI